MSQPSNIDIISGLDPTAFPSITGAQLETMVGGATPYSDKGIVMVTTDIGGVAQVPTANVTTKWQTYLWLQISPSTTSVTLFAWNPNQTNANPNFLNWQPVIQASIPAGSIQGYQLAPSTITYDKILNIQLSQVVGYTSLLTTVLNPTAGDISGSYALGFTIGNGKCTLAKLDTTGTSGFILKANGAGVAPSWLNSQIVSGLTNPDAGGANDGQLVAVNSGAVGTYKYINPTSTVGIAFTSTNIALSAGTISTQAHGLSAKPGFVRGVLVCVTAELGYNIGDEINLDGVQQNTTNGFIGSLSANATNVVYQFINAFGGTGSGVNICRISATAGTSTPITLANWKVKIYARL